MVAMTEENVGLDRKKNIGRNPIVDCEQKRKQKQK